MVTESTGAAAQRTDFLFIHTTRSRSENKGSCPYPHHPNTNLIQNSEPLTHRKKSINLPVLAQKELELLKSAGREASHLSLPFPNPGTWMPGQLPITAPKPKAAVQLQTPKSPRVPSVSQVWVSSTNSTESVANAARSWRLIDGKAFVLSRLTVMTPQQDLAGKGSPQI